MKVLFNIGKIKAKISAIWRILTNKHWVVINMSTDELRKQLKGDDFTMEIFYYGLRDYNTYAMFHQITKIVDEKDLEILRKQFLESAKENL